MNRTMAKAEKVTEIIAHALDIWSRETPLNFRQVYEADTSDIKVMFAR